MNAAYNIHDAAGERLAGNVFVQLVVSAGYGKDSIKHQLLAQRIKIKDHRKQKNDPNIIKPQKKIIKQSHVRRTLSESKARDTHS